MGQEMGATAGSQYGTMADSLGFGQLLKLLQADIICKMSILMVMLFMRSTNRGRVSTLQQVQTGTMGDPHSHGAHNLAGLCRIMTIKRKHAPKALIPVPNIL